MRGLYNDFITIISESVIKYSSKADEYETLDIRKSANEYINAKNATDNFFMYTEYTDDMFYAAGVSQISTIEYYREDLKRVPELTREKLLILKRSAVISSYVEKNNYYRELSGLPPYGTDESEYLYFDAATCLEYGLSELTPIHMTENRILKMLDDAGVLSTVISANPTKGYLKYLGYNTIDIVRSRSASNFELILTPHSAISDNVDAKFKIIYPQCREYFMSVIYIKEYKSFIDYYDEFIGLCIMMMTLHQIVMRFPKSVIDREFFDDYAINLLFNQYSIPIIDGISAQAKRSLCQNINTLIQNKSTDKVLYNIASIMGITNLSIYKYLIVKQRNYDENNVPITATKTYVDDDNNTVTEPDYEKMWDIYFQKVEMNDMDNFKTIHVAENQVKYDDVVENDPFWVDDDNLKTVLYETEYNYVETKYLSVSISFKLTSMMFECVYLIKMLLDNRADITNLGIPMSNVTGNNDVVPLFDIVVFLCALLSKKNHLNGDLIVNGSGVLHVLGFNFNANFQTIIEYIRNSKYIDDEVIEYISNTKTYTIAAINSMYTNIKDLRDYISNAMSKCTDIKEYREYEKLYRSLFLVEDQRSIFNMGTADEPVYPDTYLEYLGWLNPDLAELVTNATTDLCGEMIDNTLGRLDSKIDIEYLYLMNGNSGASVDAFVKLIKFFKSYTTDMIGLNTVYVLDLKPLNMMKLIDALHNIRATIKTTGNINIEDEIKKTISKLYHTDDMKFVDGISKYIINIKTEDGMTLKDMINTYASITLDKTRLNWFDFINIMHKTAYKRDSISFSEYYEIESTVRTKDTISLHDTISVIVTND